MLFVQDLKTEFRIPPLQHQNPEESSVQKHVELEPMWKLLTCDSLWRILHLLLTESSLEGSRPPAASHMLLHTVERLQLLLTPELRLRVTLLDTSLLSNTSQRTHTCSRARMQLKESKRITEKHWWRRGSSWEQMRSWGRGRRRSFSSLRRRGREDEGDEGWQWLSRWAGGGEDEEVSMCEEMGVRRRGWGGEEIRVRKWWWGAGAEGEKKEDGIPREWKWGGEHLDCYAPAILWLPLCYSSQMWKGPQLMWSLSKQKKMVEKFSDLFFLFYILHFPNTWLVSVCVGVCASIYLSMCVLQCKRENKIMHFAG